MIGKNYWTTDKIISTCAILISLMTLVVLIVQTKMIREQQRNSVLPHLSLGFHNNGGPNMKFVLSNDGIGPAFIESVRVLYQDSIYETDFPSFLFDNFESMDSIENLFYSDVSIGRLIPAGEQINILQIDNSPKDAYILYSVLATHSDDMTMEIVYKSVYGDLWMIDTNSYEPRVLN